MSRNYSDWLSAFVAHCSHTEAPAHMHYWAGVSAIAGALGRGVYINQRTFCWYPNHYIVLVGPPEVISKSTTMSMGTRLLREVDKDILGPSSGTWPALLKHLETSGTQRMTPEGMVTLSTCTCSISELGNFLKTDDRDMMDVLIDLWDGTPINKKIIREGGSVKLDRPLLNLNGCTTPSWIQLSISPHMAEGGLFSRMVFVYADKKERLVPYPADAAPADFDETAKRLVADLRTISRFNGEYSLSEAAKALGVKWYGDIQSAPAGTALSRKQTHVHKLAMVIAASRHDHLVIERPDLEEAIHQIELLEGYRRTILEFVGRHLLTPLSDALIEFVRSRGKVERAMAYRYLLAKLPNKSDFDNILHAACDAGYITLRDIGGKVFLVFSDPTEK